MQAAMPLPAAGDPAGNGRDADLDALLVEVGIGEPVREELARSGLPIEEARSIVRRWRAQSDKGTGILVNDLRAARHRHRTRLAAHNTAAPRQTSLAKPSREQNLERTISDLSERVTNSLETRASRGLPHDETDMKRMFGTMLILRAGEVGEAPDDLWRAAWSRSTSRVEPQVSVPHGEAVPITEPAPCRTDEPH